MDNNKEPLEIWKYNGREKNKAISNTWNLIDYLAWHGLIQTL